jgi:hypothetical protein
VVDVIRPSRSGDEGLADDVLASLAGCREVLLADVSAPAPEGVPVRPVTEEFALAA